MIGLAEALSPWRQEFARRRRGTRPIRVWRDHHGDWAFACRRCGDGGFGWLVQQDAITWGLVHLSIHTTPTANAARKDSA